MSRELDTQGSSDVLTADDNLGITGYPFSIFLYVKDLSPDLTQTNWFFRYKNDSTVSTNYIGLRRLGGADTADNLIFYDRQVLFSRNIPTTAGANDDTWQPVLITVTAGGTITVHAFGVAVTNSAPTWDANNTPTIEIGGASSNSFQGRLAHFTVWDVELSAPNIALLVGGDDPATIDVANQTRYWSFLADGVYTDAISSVVLTNSGTIHSDDNPSLNVYTPEVVTLSNQTAAGISSTELSGSVDAVGTIDGLLYWRVASTTAEPATDADFINGVDANSYGSQTLVNGTNTVASMGNLNAGETYYVQYLSINSVDTSAIVTTTAVATLSASVTFPAIVGGADLTGLDWFLVTGYRFSTATIIDRGINATTDGSGNLLLDLSGLSVAHDDWVTVFFRDAITAPDVNSDACWASAQVVVV